MLSLVAVAASHLLTAQPVLTVEMPDGRRIVVEDDAWAQLKQESVTVKEKDGKHRYDGVMMHTLLETLEIPLGEKLKGSDLAIAVVVEATDGYSAVFGIGDVDPATGGKSALLARVRDKGPLSADQGPVMLVVAADKRHARNVRMVQRIRLVRMTPASVPAPPPPAAKAP